MDICKRSMMERDSRFEKESITFIFTYSIQIRSKNGSVLQQHGIDSHVILDNEEDIPFPKRPTSRMLTFAEIIFLESVPSKHPNADIIRWEVRSESGQILSQHQSLLPANN